eukprot:gene916-1779_t
MRHWKLTKKILVDVTKILLLGKRTVLRALLHIHRLFSHTSTHYLLNKLYIDDYCIWIQNVSDGVCESIGNEYNKIKKNIKKGDLNLNLINIENNNVEVEVEVDDDTNSTSSTTSRSIQGFTTNNNIDNINNNTEVITPKKRSSELLLLEHRLLRTHTHDHDHDPDHLHDNISSGGSNGIVDGNYSSESIAENGNRNTSRKLMHLIEEL